MQRVVGKAFITFNSPIIIKRQFYISVTPLSTLNSKSLCLKHFKAKHNILQSDKKKCLKPRSKDSQVNESQNMLVSCVYAPTCELFDYSPALTCVEYFLFFIRTFYKNVMLNKVRHLRSRTC